MTGAPSVSSGSTAVSNNPGESKPQGTITRPTGPVVISAGAPAYPISESISAQTRYQPVTIQTRPTINPIQYEPIKNNKFMASVNPLGDKYTFTVANAHSSAYVVALLPGPFNTLGATSTFPGTASAQTLTATIHYHSYTEIAYAFSSVTAIADDGTIDTSLTGTAGNAAFKIRAWRNYVRQNVLLCKELQITVDNAAGLSEALQITEWTPLTQAPTNYINLNDYYDPYQTVTTKVVIPMNLRITPNTVMIQNVPAGRTYTYTFKF